MAYRCAKVEVVAADDSSLEQVLFERTASLYQTKDLETFSTVVRLASGASETEIAIAPVTTGYFLALLSDYPIMVRINGAMATQFTLKSNNVPATNVGAPKPDQCLLLMTGTVTSLRVAPISGATDTANIRVFVSGDPVDQYT